MIIARCGKTKTIDPAQLEHYRMLGWVAQIETPEKVEKAPEKIKKAKE